MVFISIKFWSLLQSLFLDCCLFGHICPLSKVIIIVDILIIKAYKGIFLHYKVLLNMRNETLFNETGLGMLGHTGPIAMSIPTNPAGTVYT